MNRNRFDRFGLLAATLIVSVVLVGCAMTAQPEPEPAVVLVDEQPALPPDVAPEPTPEPRPELAAAQNQQISAFGELPDRGEVPYFTRTSTSLRQHTFAEEGADFDTCISRAGDWMIFASTRHNVNPDIYYKQVDGVAVTQLTSDPASDVQPVFSPDRSKVAFASNRAGNWDIWVVGLDGTPPMQITSSLSDEIHPSWSPDGEHLVYCSLPPKGQWELWVADAKIDGKKRFFGYGLFPEWSPNSDTILFQRARERGSRWFSVWTIRLINDEPRYPTEIAASTQAALITPCWNADGTRIAYSAVVPSDDPEAQKADIWVVDVDGRNRLQLTDGHTANFGPAWSPAGRVFFTGERDGHETIWSLMPVGGEEAASPLAPAQTASDNVSNAPRTRTNQGQDL